MKKDADLSAAEVAPISGTGGTWGGMGESSMTPDCEDFEIASRWDTLCGQRMVRQRADALWRANWGCARRWIATAALATK
jgi:hypothetical protein